MPNQSGKIILIIILLLLLISAFAYYTYVNYQKHQVENGIDSINVKNSYQLEKGFREQDNSVQTPNRKIYDFEKILLEKFVLHKDTIARFSIGYPQEAELYDFGVKAESDPKLSPLKAEGGVNISLVSQLAEGTELFDGLSIDITYYRNSSKLNLQSLRTKMLSHYLGKEPNKIRIDEMVFINNLQAYRFSLDDWGGEDVDYYFFSRDENYVINVSVFSVGPDKESFDRVADKIVHAFEI